MTSKTTIYETKLNDGWINQIIVYDPEIDTYPFIDFKFKKKELEEK